MLKAKNTTIMIFPVCHHFALHHFVAIPRSLKTVIFRNFHDFKNATACDSGTCSREFP